MTAVIGGPGPPLSPEPRGCVAFIIPAHNEASVIGATLASVTAIASARDVFVFCDACSDATADVALRRLPPENVIESARNVGKSRGIELVLESEVAPRGYPYVAVIDADTTVDRRFVEAALPVLERPDTACAVGQVKSRWYSDSLISVYRTFVYLLWQALFKRLQSAVNGVTIASGCSTIWKTHILLQLNFDHRMSTEDFVLTMEVHRRRLGKVKYVPGAVVWTQDPFDLAAYRNQTYRWMRAWWEAVRRFRVGMAWFRTRRGFPVGLNALDITTALLLVLVYGFLGLMIALPLLVALAPRFDAGFISATGRDDYIIWLALVYATVPALALVVAIVTRRPRVFVYSPAFLVLIHVDTWIALRAFLSTLRSQYRRVPAGREQSVWVSPPRRAVADPDAGRRPAAESAAVAPRAGTGAHPGDPAAPSPAQTGRSGS